jgi:hypothetical protein
MLLHRVGKRRPLVLTTALVACLTAGCVASGGSSGTVAPPPVAAPFDYQIGGPYPPPHGVRVVTRDSTASPARGLYNICYVNAFQTQPDGAEGQASDWDPDLLLREDGRVVSDDAWGEALLDIRTPQKRRRVLDTVKTWIDRCADKGFDAVEPDNYDSYTRSKGLITPRQAQQYIRLLAGHAHHRGLAVAQKNTVELAGHRAENGLDFAVAEQCGEHVDAGYDECAEYVDAFDSHVVMIEYSDAGLRQACACAGEASIVRRDVDVAARGDSGYVYRTCPRARP